ncbi:MAG TPA: hypothetical protein VD833_14870 [Vicinamibacterales bacterium]|nr:hypothetical protein [Vicinamibacterales bacterium]
MARHTLHGFLLVLIFAASAQGQGRPSTLATLFQEIFGPSGLVVASEDVLLDGTNHAAHFNSAFQSEFRLVNIALTSQLAAVPLPSPASGFTYRFEPGTGTFVRSTRSFGPILAERGETIGRGRLSLGYSYQFFSFDELDGVPLANIPAVFTHDNFELGGGRADVVGTNNTITASVSQFSGALTYGVTDRFDVALAVPVVQTQLSLLSNARIQRVGTGSNVVVHYFVDQNAIGGFGNTHQFFAEGSAGGIGDLVVRGKATVLREGARALAAGIDVRLPTGDEQNLLGSGALGVRGFAAFSSSLGAFAPHANVAYQWNGDSVLAGDVSTGEKDDLPDQFGFALGSDLGVNERFSIVVDFLGQRVFNSPRLTSRTFTASGPAGTMELPDIRLVEDSYWLASGAVGVKGHIATRALLVFNLKFRLNDNGLTDKLTPLLGMEWNF